MARPGKAPGAVLITFALVGAAGTRYDPRMLRSSLVTATVVALVAAFAGTGCNLLKKKGGINGSCERADDTFTGGTRRCRDIIGKPAGCISEETESKKPCPKDASLVAGCRSASGDEVEWFYSEPAKGGSSTLQSVGKYCVSLSKGTTLMPDGSVVNGDEIMRNETKKYADEHGAKAKTTLANLAKIATKLPAPTGKVDLQGLRGDVLLVHKEDLAALESPTKLAYRLEEAGKLAACSRLLNGRKQPNDEPYEISYCAKNPILAVISVTTYSPPTSTGESVSGNTKTLYVKKGRIAGDVLFFRSDDGKYLGSDGFILENDDDSATLPRIMTEHLLQKWPGALHSRMKRAAPGMTNSGFTLKKD